MADDKTPPGEDVDIPADIIEEEDPAQAMAETETPPETKTDDDLLAGYETDRKKTVEDAKKPPTPPKEMDVRDWQMRMFSEAKFADMRVPDSALRSVQKEKLDMLVRQGYQGADIDYVAANLAYDDPRVARVRNGERTRDRAAGEAARFERPAPNRKPENAKPQLAGRAKEIADKAGIKDPDVRASLAAELRGIAQKEW